MHLQEAALSIVPQPFEASLAEPVSAHPEYSPLRYQRVLRGWSLQDVADAVRQRCCSEESKPNVGIGPETVRRWECGIQQPSAFYRKLLCDLYGMDAEQLGLFQSGKRRSQLQQQRLLHGWTLQQVADLLYERCCAEGKPDVGVMADTVGRWERGNARPSPKYRKHLCALYGMNAAQLGLL